MSVWKTDLTQRLQNIIDRKSQMLASLPVSIGHKVSPEITELKTILRAEKTSFLAVLDYLRGDTYLIDSAESGRIDTKPITLPDES